MPAAKPYSLAHTLVHPLARMTPLFRYQKQVYRLGEKKPPLGGLAEHGPSWQAISVSLDALGTLQVRVDLPRDFHLMAITASATVNTALGGFRAQLYDALKKVRFADRGVLFANLGGSVSAFFLREPYQFDLPGSQILATVTNMETAANQIQIALYGQVLRFNQ